MAESGAPSQGKPAWQRVGADWDPHSSPICPIQPQGTCGWESWRLRVGEILDTWFPKGPQYVGKILWFKP